MNREVPTMGSLEIMIDDLQCEFENLFDNDSNEEEYEVVVQKLLKLRQVADQLLN